MRKINILIIFLFACSFTMLIYEKYKNNEKNILILGDNHLLELDNKNYLFYLKKEYKNINDKFISDYDKYNDIENKIKNNYYLYNKGEKRYLNIEIQKSDIIIINANNKIFMSKCNKNDRLIKEYILKQYYELNSLIKILSKLSDAKIIIIGNYCSEYNSNVSNKLNNLYKNNYINMYDMYNLYKNNNLEYNIYNKINNYVK
ncbi:MAG: hypothetical protein IJK67_02985 [Bacilli bacterium]|nr:hypothetical protein [Bacilli bacterium]